MKKLFSLLLLFALVLTGCSSSGGESKDSGKLDDIKSKKKIVVGTNSGYPPYEFYDTSNGGKKLVGYDIKIGEQLAKDLGVEIEWNDMDFDALVPSLMTKKFDIILAGMVGTEERKQTIDFSNPYFKSVTKLLAKKEKLGDFKGKESLKGKTIVVQAGTTQENAAKTIEGAKILSLPSVTDTIMAVETGKADCLFIAEVSAKMILKQYKGYDYTDIDIEDRLLEDGASIGMNKDDIKLKEEINKLLEKYEKDGLLDKWFNESVELQEKIGN